MEEVCVGGVRLSERERGRRTMRAKDKFDPSVALYMEECEGFAV